MQRTRRDRDDDSEHWRVVPGSLTLTVAILLLGRSVAASHPTRAPT